MKRISALFLVLAFLVALSGTGLAQGITGTDHDFSNQGWSGGKICAVCHTPHNSDVSVADAPLWNHEVTVATFTPYSSTTLDATVGSPDGISKLCLSCHDGTVALDNFGGQSGGTSYIGGSELIGTDLSNDHPVSLNYDAALATADGELFNPTTTNSGLGGTISDDMLFGAKLECGSCHDVHNGAGIEKFLRISNAASALCMTCHDK